MMYSMDLRVHTAISDAKHWIWATMMQAERYSIRLYEKAIADSFRTPAIAEQREYVEVISEAEFLLSAAAQAEKALARLGVGAFSDVLTRNIRNLRNVHEHWEQHRESFASSESPKRRSGRAFADEHPDSTPWSFKFDGTGLWVSSLRVDDLWAELVAAERAVLDYEAELLSAAGVTPPARDATPRELPRPWQ